MTSSPHKLWADSPIALIPTPLGNEDLAAGKAHGSQYLAQQMTHLHNMLLRVLNSIYNQAPYVSTPSDIKDFLSLVNHWRDELDHHHLTEEKCFFPAVEAATGLKGIMEANVEQHHLFEPGLEALGKYATETSVEDYDGKKLQAIIDEFGVILSKHLNEEIETLISLKDYDDKALRHTWVLSHNFILKTCNYHVQLPMLMRSTDNTFENGESGSIDFPWILFYLVEFYFARRYKNCWRFLPCSTWGNPRPLSALPPEVIHGLENETPSMAK